MYVIYSMYQQAKEKKQPYMHTAVRKYIVCTCRQFPLGPACMTIWMIRGEDEPCELSIV